MGGTLYLADRHPSNDFHGTQCNIKIAGNIMVSSSANQVHVSAYPRRLKAPRPPANPDPSSQPHCKAGETPASQSRSHHVRPLLSNAIREKPRPMQQPPCCGALYLDLGVPASERGPLTHANVGIGPQGPQVGSHTDPYIPLLHAPSPSATQPYQQPLYTHLSLLSTLFGR